MVTAGRMGARVQWVVQAVQGAVKLEEVAGMAEAETALEATVEAEGVGTATVATVAKTEWEMENMAVAEAEETVEEAAMAA